MLVPSLPAVRQRFLKSSKRLGVSDRMHIYIDTEVCKGCGLCIFYCPKEVLRFSDKRNERGYDIVEIYQPEECVGCGLCEIDCPDLAIYVENEA